MSPPPITTVRLRLTPACAADVVELHALWTTPAVRRFLWDDATIAPEVAAALVQRSSESFARRGFGLWVVRLRVAAPLIGFCGLRAPDKVPDPELLYGLAPVYWGQGLATEAGHAVLTYAFETLRLDRVSATTDALNVASDRVLQRVGMRVSHRETVEGRETVFYVIARAAFLTGS
jgi:RimJ/RimL family protein N-acetyltransferase